MSAAAVGGKAFGTASWQLWRSQDETKMRLIGTGASSHIVCPLNETMIDDLFYIPSISICYLLSSIPTYSARSLKRELPHSSNPDSIKGERNGMENP
jgi:hypothetical protein